MDGAVIWGARAPGQGTVWYTKCFRQKTVRDGGLSSPYISAIIHGPRFYSSSDNLGDAGATQGAKAVLESGSVETVAGGVAEAAEFDLLQKISIAANHGAKPRSAVCRFTLRTCYWTEASRNEIGSGVPIKQPVCRSAVNKTSFSEWWARLALPLPSGNCAS